MSLCPPVLLSPAVVRPAVRPYKAPFVNAATGTYPGGAADRANVRGRLNKANTRTV